MRLSSQSIKDLQAALLEGNGVEVSSDDAEIIGQRLISLFELVGRKHPSEMEPTPPAEALPPLPPVDLAPEAHETTPPSSESSDPSRPTGFE
jgi:hypothetical protein